MAGESQFSLFGMPTPEEIRARIGRARLEQDMAQSGGNLTNLTMLQAGRNLGDGVAGLFGAQDPEVARATERAQAIQSILGQAREVSGEDPMQFLASATQSFLQADMYEEAMQAFSQLQEIRKTEAEIGKTVAETEDTLDRPSDRYIGRQLEAARDAEKARSNAVTEGLRGAELEARIRSIDVDEAYKIARIDLDRSKVFVNELERLQENRDRQYRAYEKATTPESRRIIQERIKEIDRQIEYNSTHVGRSEWDISLGANQIDALQAEYDSVTNAASDVSEMIGAIRTDPTTAGLVGTVRRVAQSTVGTFLDLGAFLGSDGGAAGRKIMATASQMAANDLKNGLVDKSVVDQFFNKGLSQTKNFENSMSYMLARSRKGNGRLNTEDVQRAHQNVKVHGWSSSRDVVANLEYVLRELERSARQLESRMGGRAQESEDVQTPLSNEPPMRLPPGFQVLDEETGEWVDINNG